MYEAIRNKYPGMPKEEIAGALDHCTHLVKQNLDGFAEKFPAAASEGNFYRQTENDDWTNGFWTGELWLSYEHCGDEALKQAAVWQVYDFLRRIKERVVVDHHDMGFLYSPSCVAALRLLGGASTASEEDRKVCEAAREAALMAADNLMHRFQEKGQFFQAWGKVGDPEEYRLIIDCLLNMPLLFWASEETGDPSYRERAEAHIRTAMSVVIRPDFSTIHTYYFDPQTGEPTKGMTRQGNRADSIWARGQSWGIYGSALAYGYLQDPEYLRLFDGVTQCFLSHLPEDLIPYWDFDFSDGSGEPRDSSSAAIAACGLLEMARHVEKERAETYRALAERLLKALTEHCLVKDEKESNGILLHGTYAKNSPENGVTEFGVDECTTWGDYFYMEALMRLSKDWVRYW